MGAGEIIGAIVTAVIGFGSAGAAFTKIIFQVGVLVNEVKGMRVDMRSARDRADKHETVLAEHGVRLDEHDRRLDCMEER